MRVKKNWILILIIICHLPGIQITASGLRQYFSFPAYYNVVEFGASGNGEEKDTQSIQSAIDSCFSQGGGTVYFPPGTYLCGSLHLRNNVALFLDHGSSIFMSKDNEDFDPYETLDFKNASDRETSYFHYALIWGEDLEHIAIIGTGSIDCNRNRRGGPKPIALKRCSYVTIKDITIKNAPNYNISMLGTDFVNISGVSILNGYCDGIDPDACKYVRISDCFIDCFDDAIVPKSSFSLGYRRSVENLTITNCILSTNCNAIKFGTESGGGFKNVTITNCVIFERNTGKHADSGIALESVDGAEIEGVNISNISMRNVIAPVFLRLGNRGRDLEIPTPGYLKNVIISNITATGATLACPIAGIPNHPIEGIILDNIRISFKGGGSFDGKIENVPEVISDYPESDMFGVLPSYGFYCRHVRNLKLRDIILTVDKPDKRYAMVFDDLVKLNIESIDAEKSEGASPVFRFNNVRQVVIRGCIIPMDISEFMEVSENQMNEIQFVDNFKFQK